MQLSEATWTEVEAAAPSLALVPVGSTEQHGPHAPLGTDTLTARTIADAADDCLAERSAKPTATDVVVTPPVAVGVSEEHRVFDGTLWVSPDTFRAYCRETVESLAAAGIDRAVFVNGHGGNTEALAELARRLSRDKTAYSVVFTWFDAVDAPEMGHAGPVETALLQHAVPELVREHRLEAAAAGAADGWGEWCHGVALAHDSDEFTDNGVVGDPTDADADRGERLLTDATAALVDVIDRVAERQL